MPGPFAPFFSGSSDSHQPQGYAGPVPARSPGQRNRTDRIIPRPKVAPAQGAQALDAPDRDFVLTGFKCSNWPDAEGCLWKGDDANAEAKRMRALALLIPYMAQLFDDMYAAIQQVMLKNTLSKEPKSMALALVSVGLDLVSGGIASKVGAGLQGVATAGKVAKGIREATDQVIPAFVNIAAQLPAKDIEKVAKGFLTFGKKKAEEAIGGIAGNDFEEEKARKGAFLNALQASFRSIAASLVESFSTSSDTELLVLILMAKHGPNIAEFKAKFTDMMERYELDGIGKIGTTYTGGGKFELVRITAYGQETYLVVAQNGTGYIKTSHVADSRGEREYSDGQAGLVSIVSPDLVDMAIQQSGGAMRDHAMTWKSYQKGQSPFPTLDLRKSEREWSFTMRAQFEKWITDAYKQAHGGKSPPKPKDQDPFGWWHDDADDDSGDEDVVPANASQQSPVTPQPSASPAATTSAISQDDMSAAADAATSAVGDLF